MNNNHAFIRYRALDACLRNRRRWYYFDDLMEVVSKVLYEFDGSEVKERTLREDIARMERDAISGGAVIEKLRGDDNKIYYRYSDPHFTLFRHELTEDEARVISETIQLLSRFRGMPRYEWVDETLLHLREHFQLDEDIAGVVSFAQNPDLVGLHWWQPLFEAIVSHRVLRLQYHRFGRPVKERTLHPYQMKQWNYRWYLVGLESEKQGDHPCQWCRLIGLTMWRW